SVAAGSTVTVSVALQNSGVSKLAYERSAYLVLRGPANYVVGSLNPAVDTYTRVAPQTQMNTTLSAWDKGTTTTFSQTFLAPTRPGTYGIRLYIPDADCVNNSSCNESVKVDYAIRLATTRNGSNVFDRA